MHFLGRGSRSLNLLRDLEYAGHFYGRPVPLLHTFSKRHGYELMIIDVGGLLFVWNSDDPVLYVVDTGVSLNQLIACVENGRLPAKEVQLDASEAAWEFWFPVLLCYEQEGRGRNRCQELCERGGRINPGFLKRMR